VSGDAGREDREIVVVGAGLLGLAAAGALVRRGRDVVLLEQAGIGHPGGGSHGSARIFRYGYADPGYVAMARRARELWSELEDESGQRLLLPTGQLTFGDGLPDLLHAMREAGAPSNCCRQARPPPGSRRSRPGARASTSPGPASSPPGGC